MTTAENDNRVVPSHSLKFLAELQCKLELTGDIGTHNSAKAPPDSSVFLGQIYSDTGHERQ